MKSVSIFRVIGLDFVSGERVLSKALLSNLLGEIHLLPRFGVEVFMNRQIIARRLPISVTHWPQVTQSRKTEKMGYWKGVLAELRMICDLFQVAYPHVLILQAYHLLSLRVVTTPLDAGIFQKP